MRLPPASKRDLLGYSLQPATGCRGALVFGLGFFPLAHLQSRSLPVSGGHRPVSQGLRWATKGKALSLHDEEGTGLHF